jgi:hypothetical protein
VVVDAAALLDCATLCQLMSKSSLMSESSRTAGREVLFWTLLPHLVFAIPFVATFKRWILPFEDSGREMNTALRLAEGEALYRDVGYSYGPLPIATHLARGSSACSHAFEIRNTELRFTGTGSSIGSFWRSRAVTCPPAASAGRRDRFRSGTRRKGCSFCRGPAAAPRSELRLRCPRELRFRRWPVPPAIQGTSAAA